MSFLTNQYTIIKTNEHITSKLSIDFRLPQGLPLLSIFYLFYNTDLLDDSTEKEIEAQGFIDNITLIIISKSIRSNN